jgi:hypothetical protein
MISDIVLGNDNFRDVRFVAPVATARRACAAHAAEFVMPGAIGMIFANPSNA